MRRPRSGLIAVALTLCAACGLLASFLGFGAGSASGAGSGAAAITKVTVIATEFHFKLSKTKVPVGAVIFTVENKGKIAHDFKIGGKRTPLIPAGKRRRSRSSSRRRAVTPTSARFPAMRPPV